MATAMKTLFAVVCFFLALTLTACGPDAPATTTPATTAIPVQPTPSEPWSADGIIGDNEYTGSFQAGNYELFWTTDGTVAYFGIRARTNGWVSLGFQPDRTMRNADIIIGYVQDGQTHISDEFSTDAFGPHVPDTTLGGTFDIIEYGGSNDGTFTVLEFSRNFITGDDFDIELTAGTNKIIWAYGPSTDTERKHIVRGYGELELQ